MLTEIHNSYLVFIVLVGLYEEPERPANAVDYIKRYMGAPAGVDVEALRVEVEQLRADNAKLQATIKDLNSKVSLHFVMLHDQQANILTIDYLLFRLAHKFNNHNIIL